MTIVRTVLMLVAAVAASGPALAQTSWPDRPIRLIVPFQPGSSSDTIARIVGTEAIARAEPDGYTLGLANTTTHAATSGIGSVPFDPIKDFSPVAMIGSSPFVLLVTPGLAVNSVQDLIAIAKAKPGVLNYASAGVGSMTHLAGALFASMAGVKLTHVPYRGTGQSVLDIMEGRIEILFGTIAPSLPHIRAGKLRALATTGQKRTETLPELPTLAEAGLAGYEAALWTAFVYPAAVSPALVARLNADVNAVVGDPEIVASLKKQGVDTDTGPPAMVKARIEADLAKWRDVIKKAGIQ